jgi:hypothetical protein
VTELDAAIARDIDHVLRPSLPWRNPAPGLTECGREPGRLHVLTREEFVEKYRRLGQQRSALTTCMTCWHTVRRWPTWDADPVMALTRELQSAGEQRDQIRRELLALAVLAATYSQTFTELLAGLRSVEDLAARRQARRRTR